MLAPITHRCDGTYDYDVKCSMVRHADGIFTGHGCGELCSWIMGKSGHGVPPWKLNPDGTRFNPTVPDENFRE